MTDEVTRADVMARLTAFSRVVRPQSGLRQAAVAIAIVRDATGGLCFLLTRRAAKLTSHPRQYALPGGKIDPGETAQAAAQRELREELGLPVADTSVVGVLDDYVTRSGFVMTPVVLWCADDLYVLVASVDEVAEVFEVPLTDLDVLPEFVTIPESSSPVIRLPLLGRYVHAPTGAILHQFGEVVLHGREVRVSHYEQPAFAWR